ncbi:hypothetical protein KKG41_01025 [Patescibacteria group bacterium]|nr:hypothetical protein [Patescibacteria group bacterium]MBU1890286.1 hypothetical protein [Patescibacteria group bacterium]
MKKLLIFTIILFFAAVLTPQADAATWKDRIFPAEPYMAGDCFMVDQPSEADETHVYTLNPDNTNELSMSYLMRWRRNARCDELQFHVDHNTPLSRLNAWLDEIAYGWYANISTSHLKHQTVSTTRHEWFYIGDNGIHRIPDWLTGLSWGLLIGDRISIPSNHTEQFYNTVALGTPLSFNDGTYASEIDSIWHDGITDYSDLPDSMVEEIDLVMGQMNPFTDCSFGWGAFPGNPWRNLFDWSYMLRNPGCALAD